MVQVYDRLTGLYDKKYFLEHLELEVLRCGRYRRPLSVLMLEVQYDYFMPHLDVRWSMGYGLFKQLGAILLGTLRHVDMAARYDGDKVAIFLPETGREGAVVAAERIRSRVENHPFIGTDTADRVRLAVNLGISVFPRHGTAAEELLLAARDAMLAAREQGGNRVVLASPPEGEAVEPPATDAPTSWDELAREQKETR